MARAQTYAYGKKYKSCPCCIRKENPYRYFAYCTSEKNPKYHGIPVEIKDQNKGALCIGRKLNGMSYTSCPYYIRGGSKSSPAKEQSSPQARRSGGRDHSSVDMTLLLKLAAAAIILLFIAKMIL